MLGVNNSRLDLREWHTEVLPAAAQHIPSMLHPTERQLLHFLSRVVYTGEGIIVDSGCWLGGSTLSLGLGLQANQTPGLIKDGRIQVYDQFLPDQFMKSDPLLKDWLEDINDHTDFRRAYDRNVSPVASNIVVHDGDITAQPAPSNPIEILFVDVSKTVQIEQWIRANFYASLRPGSILVHQDFFDPWSAWLPLSMAHLRDYFRLVGTCEWATAIFVCTKQIPSSILGVNPIEYFSMAEALRLLDDTYSRRVTYLEEAALAIQKGVLARYYKDPDLALALAEVAAKSFPDVPRCVSTADILRKDIDASR